ncbi:MAG: NADH-quinone oxidoreductase subunit H [Phycisphaerales bacterium]
MADLQEMIQSTMSPQLFISLLVMAIVVHVILGSVTICIYGERKISAYIQDRIGPNRTGFDFGLPVLSFLKGFLGLGQALADGLKFFVKEDYRPTNVDKVLFTLAPAICIVPALIGFVILPWGGMLELGHVSDWAIWSVPVLGDMLYALWVQDLAEWLFWDDAAAAIHVTGAHVSIGVVYLLAVASLGVYGITLGGWSSNNKYSFIGGLRATAQMISYEIPMGLSLLAMLLVLGTFMPEEIIRSQVEGGWGILSMPLAAVLFYVCALAESNRAPFDNAEAEQELVGGYHTEYSSMRFALFFLAEYAHLITGSAFFALLFLGGYHLPGPGLSDLTSPENTSLLAVIIKFHVFFTKAMAMVFFAMLIRWTIPRMRYDQVMQLGWQSMIPLGMVLIVATSVMVHMGWTGMGALIVMNIGVAAIVMVAQPILSKAFGSSTGNRKIKLYGSRFNPVDGEVVSAAPTEAMALEDRPVQGTVQTV